jgi:L-alanine-DL-glutamate epimerase-like enolase superfamily enzyme
MRITEVEPILLRGTEATGRPRAPKPWTRRLAAAGRVATDEDQPAGPMPRLAPAAVAVIASRVWQCSAQDPGRAADGENPLDVERLWDKLYIGSAYYGRRGLAMQCISAIDNCLWSIRAQAAGVSLARLIGARRRDSVLAYASTLFRDTPDGMAEAARGYVAKGFALSSSAGRVRRGHGRDRGGGRRAQALGPDHLLVDPGWYPAGWNPEPCRCAAAARRGAVRSLPTTRSAG